MPPLGYDLPAAGTRTLQVNETEAQLVRQIFQRYLELGSVHHLQAELARSGIVSKRRVTGSGKVVGGVPIGRGALFHLLRSRIYLGQIPHKDTFYPGAHPPIVDAVTFDQAGAMLAKGARRSTASQRRVAGALLTGRIVDSSGAPMSPAFSYGRGKKVYRYYVAASLQQGASCQIGDVVRRVSAPAIEALVTKALERLYPAGDFAALKEVRVGRRGIALTLPASLRPQVQERLGEGEELTRGSTGRTIVVMLPVAVPLRGGARSIVAGQQDSVTPDPVLISALRRAHAMLGRARGLPTMDIAPTSPYDRRILRLAFLAPEIHRSILSGRQPPHFNLEYLLREDIPLSWARQRSALGCGPNSPIPVIA